MKKAVTRRRWSIEKRLEFIDFQLFWNGQINRSDIMEKFGVSVPQASKDLGLYQEVAASNINYDRSEKRYLATKTFKPKFFKPDANAYLMQLRDDVNKLNDTDVVGQSYLPIHDTVPMPARIIDPNILREVTTASRECKSLKIFYQSMSSAEPSWRSISPHAFAFDGLRWHTRAFCHKDNVYKDFLLPRILKVGNFGEKTIPTKEDYVWQDFVTVCLKPHPKLNENQSKAVALDYNMKNMQLNVEVRLALLYYFLKRLNLDFEEERRKPQEQHVVLANKAEVKKALNRAQYTH